MSGYPSWRWGRLTMLLALAMGAAAWAAAPPMKTASLPPRQRLLSGEQARRAEQLQQQVDRHWQAAQFEQALKPAQELAAMRGKVQGQDHWEAVNARWQVKVVDRMRKQEAARRKEMAQVPALRGQAAALEAKGRAREALPLRQQVLAVCRKLLGEDHPHTAASYHSLADNQKAQGKYAEAQGNYQKALDLNRKLLGEDHPHTAASYHNLAFNQGDQGRYAEAQGNFQKALDLCRKLLGEDHPDTARSYNNLGYSQYAQGKYAEAERNFQKALDLRRKLLGEDHPDTARSYNHIAGCLNRQGRYGEALALCRRALAIRQKVLGEDHTDTANSYNNLAHNQSAQGKYAEAQGNYQKALDLRRKLLGEDHPATAASYHNLASNQQDQGKYAEALGNLQKALDLRRKLLGEEHPNTANSYNSLAYNQNAQGKYAEAQGNFQKALDLRRKLLGEEHPNTANSYNNLAYNQSAQGKYAEAQGNYQKALDLCRKLLGEDHPDTANSYNSLAYNQNAQGKYAEAQGNFQKALDLNRKLLGEEHPATAASYHNLAYNQGEQGRYAEAERNFQKALELHRKLLGEDHPHTARSYSGLAVNQRAQGKYAEAEKLWARAADALERIRLWAAPSGLERAAARDSSPLLVLATILALNDKPVEAWRRFEQGLARGTWDDLAQRRLLSQQEVDRRAMLRHQLDRLDRHLEQALALKDPAQREQHLKELSGQRLQARQALEEMARQLDQKHGPAAGKALDQAAVQQALPADAALLGWIDVKGAAKSANPGGEHWGVLLRSRGEPVWVRLPGSGAKRAWTDADWQLAADLRQALVGRGAWQPIAEKLQQQRFAPLHKHLAATKELPAVRQLIVLPSVHLKDVPVEVIAPTDCTVSYAPSGSLFAYLRGLPRAAGRDLLALADPIFESARKDPPAGPLPPGGLLLSVVVPGGAGVKAGLRPGDVLLRYASTQLKSVEELTKAIAARANDTKEVELSLWRDGETRTVLAAPGKLGVVLAREPAPKALAQRRLEQKQLALARSADDGIWQELPGTRVEAEGLRRLFLKQGRQVTLLCDSEASEQRLDGLARAGRLKDYRYLHLATHGELDDRGLLRSRLILSKDNLPDPDTQMRKGEPIYDGNLTAAEALLGWKLDCELVTLSACETALGKYEVGESYVGFPQALLLAGSRSVCVSLWKVNDTATALLMTRFYQNLLGARAGLKGPLAKAQALQEAKEWLRGLSRAEALRLGAEATKGVARGKRPAMPPSPGGGKAELGDGTDRPYAHPYFWAGFILIGAPD